ncbi:hypothetical protein Ae717Ps2_6860 [Pseudonocardia sp. Ae717_Ps2]|uniref:UTRA domain-containing protein n=1 Tax=Pseudonocardia sp. Ae717_Ps2 TaxID=1885573 RepID=UPI00094AEAAE|nr:hypothetical protein Ae717Ps2_6860 [Pseudonocardia sp. Ae717_Ps2]
MAPRRGRCANPLRDRVRPADKDAHERTDLYSFMREAGYQPAQTTERVSTRMPDPDERDVMSIPPGVPVLITLRTRATRARSSWKPAPS